MRFLFLVYGVIILFGVTFYTMASMGDSSSSGKGGRSSARGWGGSSGSGWSSGGGHK
ncbi:hypothetical protein [Cupriavidus sp. D384]|uniref:hypothetical protein n=1 Tax=Cupriavidus sp. D384 TaxID=1538095 RepID=UPI000A755B16|nr:hypothetical protein [Cupriavidus sp. D384]